MASMTALHPGSSPFVEPRLSPLTETFLHCRDPLAWPIDSQQDRPVPETWALGKFGPSRLRRRHTLGGFVPHFLAQLKKPNLETLDRPQRRLSRCTTCPDLLPSAPSPEPWPNTDDEMEQDVGSPGDGSDNEDGNVIVGEDNQEDQTTTSSLPPSPALSQKSRTTSLSREGSKQTRGAEPAVSLEAAIPGDAEDGDADAEKVTTMMIRNLPAEVTQTELMQELDTSGFEGTYNFVYVPSSFEMHLGKGYAFVNFRTTAAAMSLLGSWHGFRRFLSLSSPTTGTTPPPPPPPPPVAATSTSSSSTSGAVLNISPAHVQGLEANIKKWERMSRVRDVRLRPYIAPEVASRGNTLSTSAGMTGPLDETLRTLETEASPVSSVGGHTRFASCTPTHRRTDMGATSSAASSPMQATSNPFLGRFGGADFACSPDMTCSPDHSPIAAGDRSVPSLTSTAPARFSLANSLTDATSSGAPLQPSDIQDGITTLMIRNIPKEVTQQVFLEELDHSGFENLYDFAYLPSSFEAREGKGYAFLNFMAPAAAAAFVATWQRSRRFPSDTCELPLNISAAAVQGLEANARKWTGPRMHRIRNPALRPFVRSSGGAANTPGSASNVASSPSQRTQISLAAATPMTSSLMSMSSMTMTSSQGAAASGLLADFSGFPMAAATMVTERGVLAAGHPNAAMKPILPMPPHSNSTLCATPVNSAAVVPNQTPSTMCSPTPTSSAAAPFLNTTPSATGTSAGSPATSVLHYGPPLAHMQQLSQVQQQQQGWGPPSYQTHHAYGQQCAYMTDGQGNVTMMPQALPMTYQ